MLIDTGAVVSTAYDVMQWASGTGEPGHTFVLVDQFGHLAWLRDYGAADNGGSMYVPVNELVAAVNQSLQAIAEH